MPWSRHQRLRDARRQRASSCAPSTPSTTWRRRSDVSSLLAAQDRGAGMPWVNTIAADRAGRVLYADHSVVPNVPDDLVQTCSTPTGVVLEQLAGLPGAGRHPRAQRLRVAHRRRRRSARASSARRTCPKEIRRDWVVNANDSYWLPNPKQPLEGYDGIIGCERCERTLRTRMVYRYVLDRLAGTDGLARGPQGQPAHAEGHRARQPGVRRRAGPGRRRPRHRLPGGRAAARACDVLQPLGRALRHRQRGHAHLPGVLEAGAGRARSLAGAVRPRRPGGHAAGPERRQPAGRAGDARRAGPTSTSGGSRPTRAGGACRSPATTVRRRSRSAAARGSRATRTPSRAGKPAANLERLYPVSYGSSHIQAIAFRPHGPADRADDPHLRRVDGPRRKRTSQDQTRLFSRERWVSFPWTARQVRRDAVRIVRGPRPLKGSARGPGQRGQPSWPRSWASTRDRMRETCIWVTPISSAIWAWVCCLKKRR